MLPVKGILCLHHTRFPGFSQLPGAFHQGKQHLKVGDGGKFDGRVFPAGALHPHRPCGDNDIIRFHIQADAAAGSHPNKGIRPDSHQLLQSDDRRRPADTGGHHAHRLPLQRACVGSKFPVGSDFFAVIQVSRDFLAPSRVAGKDAVAAHVPLLQHNMKLPLPM